MYVSSIHRNNYFPITQEIAKYYICAYGNQEIDFYELLAEANWGNASIVNYFVEIEMMIDCTRELGKYRYDTWNAARWNNKCRIAKWYFAWPRRRALRPLFIYSLLHHQSCAPQWNQWHFLYLGHTKLLFNCSVNECHVNIRPICEIGEMPITGEFEVWRNNEMLRLIVLCFDDITHVALSSSDDESKRARNDIKSEGHGHMNVSSRKATSLTSWLLHIENSVANIERRWKPWCEIEMREIAWARAWNEAWAIIKNILCRNWNRRAIRHVNYLSSLVL